MSALQVLTVGVCLIAGSAQAMDIAAGGNADWSAQQKAGSIALQAHRYPQAAEIFSDSLKLAASCDERANTLSSLGIALTMQDRNTEAKSALERAMSEWAKTSNGDRVLTLGVLATVNRSLGDYQGAERALRSGIADPVATRDDHVTLLVNLADLLREQGLDGEALAALRQTGRLTELSSDQQTNVMLETAELYRDMRRWDESLEIWSKLLETAERTHATRLEETVTDGLGETWMASGNLARAEPLLRRAVQLARSDPDGNPTQIATALSTMVHLYIDEGKLALAEDLLMEALAKDESSLGPDHPQVAMLLELRAMIFSGRNEMQAAREQLERAKTIMSAHFGGESLAVAAIYGEMGELETHARQPQAAVLDYTNARRILLATGRENSGFGPAMLEHYAAALKATHRGDEARELMKSQRRSASSLSALSDDMKSFRTQ